MQTLSNSFVLIVSAALAIALPFVGLTVSPSRLTGFAPTLVRQPYLQRVGAETATVVWATREPGSAVVKFRHGANAWSAAATSELYAASRTGMAFDYYQHEATLTGLVAATTYEYDVVLEGVDITPETDRFTTAPPRGRGKISFVAFGDSGSGTTNQMRVAQRIAEQFSSNRWDLALHTGDVVYPKGTYQLLHDRFFAVYEDWLRRYAIFPAIGNHEDYAEDGRPYLDLFSLPDNGHTDRFPDQTERYYSFDFGPVHFIALDTQIAFSGDRLREQLNWLVRDLEATTQPWRIVFFHIPAYGSSDFASAMSKRWALQPVFERYGVQLVLAGHEHAYARGVPWREPPGLNAPVVHVVTGGGGSSLNSPVPGPWAAKWARAYHYVSVDVDDCTSTGTCTLMFEAVDLNGARIDSFSLDLRAQQRDSMPPEVAWDDAFISTMATGAVTLAATAADDEQVMKVDLLVDGELRAVDSVAPYEWTWDTTRELNGERRLQLRAVDIAGRTKTSDARVVLVANAPPTIALLSPWAGERASTTTPYRIRWAAGAGSAPFSEFRVEVAPTGKVFVPLKGCETLSAAARQCVWSTPGPASSKAVVRVRAIDIAGREAVTTSAPFRIQSTTATVAVKFPDKTTALGVGSAQSLTWVSSLGYFGQWDIELSRDGGATWQPLASSYFALDNALRWIVDEPVTADGLIRVTALNLTMQDQSNATFTIAAPKLAVTGLGGSTLWTASTESKVKWFTNLGVHDRLNVRLSIDGGASFPIVLAAAVPASNGLATITVPAVSTDQARVLLQSLGNSAWTAMSPSNFRIVVP